MSDHLHNACLNCYTPFEQHQKFCTACGQSVHLHRIGAGYILHEAIHYFTHADKGIFYLLKSLITRPGEAARLYIAGQRKKYFAPLTFFLLAVGIMVFGVKASTGELDQSISKLEQTISSQIDIHAAKGMTTQLRALKVQRFMAHYSNIVSMMATPLLVVWMWLFYRKQPYNYMEHLVANLYFVGFTALFYGLLFTPLMRWAGSATLSRIFLGFYFLVEIGYRAISYYYFMPPKGIAAVIKSIVVSLLSSVVWIILSYLTIFLYINA